MRLQCLTTLAREFPGRPATREALLAAREDPDEEVRLRAGIALGPEGRDVLRAVAAGEGASDETTERAIAALEPADAEMRRTARQAIAEIQSRLTGAEPGQLSLAGGESGQLSIAGGEEGRVSLADGSETREPSRPGPTGVAQVKE